MREKLWKIFTELHDAYANSAEGQRRCMVCLASIKNARKIIDSELYLRQILFCSGVPLSYTNCMSIGLNLSKYMDVKEGFR